jgi:hypothetical protein
MNTRSSYWCFFLFAVLWCLAITVGTDREIETHDAVEYRQQFEWIKNADETFFNVFVQNYLDYGEAASKDIYSFAVIYGVTRVIDNYHVMFMIFGIVCSFFMLKTFRFFTGDKAFNNSFPAFLLAVMFIMHNDIWNIWAVRYITATWVALYASFQILKNENKKYLLLLCATPLIHASFWGVVFLFILTLITSKLKVEEIWQVLFVMSMIVAPFAVYFAADGLQMLPANLQKAFGGYLDANYINELSAHFEVRNIFSQILEISERLFTMFLILLFMINRKMITSKQDYNIYLLLLIVGTFASFTSSVPSLGERYFRLTYPLIAYIFLKYFNRERFRWLLYMYPLVFLHHFYMSLGIQYWRTNSWDFYFLSPFYTIYKYLIAFQA